MNYIEYVDLPKVPEHLIESVQDIINKPNKEVSIVPSDYAYFKTRHVSDELNAWLQPMFDFKIYPQYQLVYKGLPIHIDMGRIAAYNYLLDTGGDVVRTAIYDGKNNLLQIEKLELKRWHRINTSMPHCVHGINHDKVRVAISIGVSSQ
jgi:hypothetical protein